jgi:predicted small integral membrane protein
MKLFLIKILREIEMQKKNNSYYRSIDNIYKKFDSNPIYHIIIAAIIAVLGLFICINAFTPVYKVNDNTALLRFIKNDYDVFYMSLLFGRYLKFMYNHVANDIAWYGISMLSSLTISLFLIVLGIIQNKRTKYLNIPLLILFLVFYIGFFHQSGFNIASILAGTSAVFYFLIYNENNTKSNIIIVLLKIMI